AHDRFSPRLSKLDTFWDGRDAATLAIGGPFFTKIQLTIHQRRALGRGSGRTNRAAGTAVPRLPPRSSPARL
ncbi:MAG: hypothetical protein ACYCPM_04490, partial [Acidobacteriaceae bacterium]